MERGAQRRAERSLKLAKETKGIHTLGPAAIETKNIERGLCHDLPVQRCSRALLTMEIVEHVQRLFDPLHERHIGQGQSSKVSSAHIFEHSPTMPNQQIHIIK